jgi:hypothetical protein
MERQATGGLVEAYLRSTRGTRETRQTGTPASVRKRINKSPPHLYKGVLKLYSIFQNLLLVLICSKNILNFSEGVKSAYLHITIERR